MMGSSGTLLLRNASMLDKLHVLVVHFARDLPGCCGFSPQGETVLKHDLKTIIRCK